LSSAAQWVAILGVSGLTGAITSLASTRLEWRRLRLDEGERSAFYENSLFDARLAAYAEISDALCELLFVTKAELAPMADQPSLSQEQIEAVWNVIEPGQSRVTRLLVTNILLFGPNMDAALNVWSGAFDELVGVVPPRPMSVERLFALYGAAHYGVLQAMRQDLHLNRLDENLLAKVGGKPRARA